MKAQYVGMGFCGDLARKGVRHLNFILNVGRPSYNSNLLSVLACRRLPCPIKSFAAGTPASRRLWNNSRGHPRKVRSGGAARKRRSPRQ
jgi:hypothetical protein